MADGVVSEGEEEPGPTLRYFGIWGSCDMGDKLSCSRREMCLS